MDDVRPRRFLLPIAAVAGFLLLGYLDARGPGVAVAALVLVAVLLVVLRAGLQPSGPVVSVPKPRDRNAGFPRYRELVTALRFADVDPVRFEQATRPVLVGIFARVLSEEHDVQVGTDPERARALIGPQLWSLLEPVPAQGKSNVHRLPRKVLEDMVSRLEDLHR